MDLRLVRLGAALRQVDAVAKHGAGALAGIAQNEAALEDADRGGRVGAVEEQRLPVGQARVQLLPAVRRFGNHITTASVLFAALLVAMHQGHILAAEGVHDFQAVGHLLRHLSLVLVDAVACEHPPEGAVQDLLQGRLFPFVAGSHRLELLAAGHLWDRPVARSIQVLVVPAPLRSEELTLLGHRDLSALAVVAEDELLLPQLT
mmetsp:Transcript_42648/g.133089  ORF Transcript_42648/g.133089 Transcript_42648/m.133089 type:complete len:204 (+) Transcript_42648:517-1128(+)